MPAKLPTLPIQKFYCISFQFLLCENFIPSGCLFYTQNIFCQYLFSKIFTRVPKQMSHNVSAVYDVLPARIRALRSKDQGWQNVPEQRRGNGAKRNDLAVVEAESPTGGEA
jgi:hypothetical protein